MSALRYGVKFASDDDMPEGHDVVVLRCPGEAIVVYRESVVSRSAVTTAWDSLRAVATAAEEQPIPVDELMARRAIRVRAELPPFQVLHGRRASGER